MTLLVVFSRIAPSTEAGIPEPDLVWYGSVVNASDPAPVRVTRGNLEWRIEPLGGGAPIVLRAALADVNGQFSYVLRVPCETPEPGNEPNPATLNFLPSPVNYRRLTVTLDGQPLVVATGPTEFVLRRTDRGRIERLDLRTDAVTADADGDGIADAWERQFFGANGADPATDSDGDGLNNLREFRAGTDPTNAASVLEFVEVSKTEGRVRLKWSSQAGKRYRIRRSANLLVRANDYEVVQAGIAGAPPVNVYDDAQVGNAPDSFYLVEVEE